jgi:putative ABC transport system substrate-binding protein
MISCRRLLTGFVLAWAPLRAAAAQESKAGKVWRIGYLGVGSAAVPVNRLEALRAGLRDLGYVERKNIVIEYRWAEGKYDRLPDLAAELVRLKVDVIVTSGTPGTLAAKQTTTTIPIVMAGSGDAVATGLVASLARPGGNITGSTDLDPELVAKQLEFLKEVMPRTRRVAVLVNPDNPWNRPVFEAMQTTAGSLKVELQKVEVRGPNEFESAFATMTKTHVDAVVVTSDPFFNANGRAIAGHAARARLLAAGTKEFAEAGGSIGYGWNFSDMFRRAAYFVDKILKGANPADLPIERATTFDLVINLETVKALGLTIPQSLLLRADEVIE